MKNLLNIATGLHKGGILEFKGIRRKVLYFLIAAILLIIISYAILLFLVPSDSTKEGFLVTINGEVTTGLVDSSKYPPYVYAYFPYYNLDQLSKGKKIELANINWKGNVGHYSMTFWLPIEMNIILTVDGSGCNHTPIYVSKENNVQTVNLVHNDKKCLESLSLPEEREDLEGYARSVLARVSEDLSRVTSAEEESKIKSDLQKGWGKFNEQGNEQDKLLYAYHALWLAWRADYRLQLQELNKCVQESSLLLKNDSCLTIPYNVELELSDANSTYSAYIGLKVLDKQGSVLKV